MHSGTQIGPYVISVTIGAGGMGEVFRARDTRLNRDVAVKVLPKDFTADTDRLRRFEQEAKTLAALNHPNILTIHDVGLHDGMPYLVSELLEGRTLREEMNGAALPSRKVTDFALQIAHGLAAAHGKAIIHRDLKPENIFVTKDGRVKILDFGLAKLSQRSAVRNRESEPVDSEAATIVQTVAETTEPGLVLGTPAYMSPEQVRGESADHRTDIFAFGCVLYEMLSGVRVFRRDTPIESMNAVLNETPAELSATSLNIPSALVRVVERCLEKRAGNRFESARDLAFALECQLDSAASGWQESRQEPTRPNRWRLLLAAGAVLFAALALGLFRRFGSGPTATNSPVAPSANLARISSVAVKPLDDYSGDTNNAYLSDGMTEALCAALGNVSSLRVPGRSSVMRYKGGQKSIREMAKELNVDAIVEGSVQRTTTNMLVTVQLIEAGTDRHLWATNYRRDLSDFFVVQNEVALAVANEVQARLSPQDAARLTQATSLNPLVIEAYLKGRFHLARGTKEGFEQSLISFNEALRLDPKFAKAYSGIADAYVIAMGWFVDDAVAMALGFRAATNAVALDSASAEPQASLGWYFTMSWRWADAEAAFQNAFRLNPHFATGGYGWLKLFTGRNDEGLNQLLHAYELDPGSPLRATDIAWACVQLGRFEMATKYINEALKLDRNFWLAQGLRGLSLAFQGNYPDAIRWTDQAVQNSGRNAEMLANLGWVYGMTGESAKAQAILQELQTTKVPRTPAPLHISWVYLGLNQPEEAIRTLQEGVRIRDPGLMFLRFDRRFDPLRQDRNFKEIMKTVGLPQ